MSAPYQGRNSPLYQGRNSPDPELQSGAQQQDPPTAGKTSRQYAGEPTHSQKESDESMTLHLESNPKHPLEDIEARKFRKPSRPTDSGDW